MKVTETTHDRLILDDIPWIRGTLFILVTIYVAAMGFREYNAGREFGWQIIAAAIIIGPLIFAVFVQRYQIIFQRQDATIIKRKRSVFGFSQTTYDLTDVSHAEVEEIHDSDGGTMYRPILVRHSTSPAIKLVSYGTTGWGPPRVVDAINDWLKVDDAPHT